MIFGSVCSGIEAASQAWHPLGWQARFFSEIEPFPAAVLRHRWPGVPNYGDLTRFAEWPDHSPAAHDPIELLVGGTPCQAFSVAGLRQGLADPRGNLTLTFLALVARYRPRWLVWENVPGVLSDQTGAFGALLGGLGQLGYGFAYRVLDAQYFGVPQRRRRVFVVGHLGTAWQRAAAVLFERGCLSWDPPPGRKTGQGIAAPAPEIAAGIGDDELGGYQTVRRYPSTISRKHRGLPRPPAGDEVQNLVAFHGSQAPDVSGDVTHPVGRNQGQECCVALPSAQVRRLTPRECERLQGFPDDYTLVPGWESRRRRDPDRLETVRYLQAAGWSEAEAEALADHPDGPRYRALGNSMAVPVMQWIGRRIQLLEDLLGPWQP